MTRSEFRGTAPYDSPARPSPSLRGAPSVRRRGAHVVAIALLVVAALLAGCTPGGGGDGSRASDAADSEDDGSGSDPGSEDSPGDDSAGDGSDGGRQDPEQRARDRAARYVDTMRLEQKAGQVIVAGFGGTEAPVSLVSEEHVGGLIVMGHNVDSAAQVGRVNRKLQEAHDQPWPLLLGVDQEGGRITRIRAPLTEFPSYQALGAARDPGLARRVARASGAELRGLGFTAVFAPDADVTIGPEDPTIGTRSAGSDPERVARTVAASVRGYREAGLVPVPKHFPGHGSVTADSHEELPVQRAGMERLRKRDLKPFRAAVDAETPAVMTGHLDVRAVDPGVPSSLSSRVTDGLLRDQLGFRGAVVTDGLHMGALTERYSPQRIAVRALQAGADVLLLPADPVAMRDGIVRAVRDGQLREQRLDEAATRMIAMQLRQQAMASDAAPGPDGAEPGSASDLAYAAALSGTTVLDGACGERLVSGRVSVVGGEERDRRLFTRAAEDAGLRVVSSDGSAAGVSSDGSDDGASEGAATVRLLESGENGAGDVVVALDSPYGLAGSDAGKARIALFGRTPQSFHALADVLTGEARATGTLPVPVRGVPSGAGCGRK